MDELRGSQQSSFSGHIAKESEKQADVSLEDYIDMEFLMESEDGNDRYGNPTNNGRTNMCRYSISFPLIQGYVSSWALHRCLVVTIWSPYK